MRLLIFCLFIAVLIACDSEKKPSSERTKLVAAIIPEADDFNYDSLSGMYVSDFGGSQINIILNYVSAYHAIGYNIHKGLQRNLNGSVSRSGDSILITLNEPGDHEFDGIFTLLFKGYDANPTGVWKSQSGKLGRQKLALQRVIYDPNSSESLTAKRISEWFGYSYDTLGNYRFQEDGLCIFSYYPGDVSSTEGEQLREITGSWTLRDSTIQIDWQANKLFSQRSMKFKLVQGPYEEYYLQGENGHNLNTFYYGP